MSNYTFANLGMAEGKEPYCFGKLLLYNLMGYGLFAHLRDKFIEDLDISNVNDFLIDVNAYKKELEKHIEKEKLAKKKLDDFLKADNKQVLYEQYIKDTTIEYEKSQAYYNRLGKVYHSQFESLSRDVKLWEYHKNVELEYINDVLQDIVETAEKDMNQTLQYGNQKLDLLTYEEWCRHEKDILDYNLIFAKKGRAGAEDMIDRAIKKNELIREIFRHIQEVEESRDGRR